MRISCEIITIFAINYLYRDKVNLVGITEEGKWIRVLNLNREDLFDEGKEIKLFYKVELYCSRIIGENERYEDRLALANQIRKIKFLEELREKEQTILIDKHMDCSIRGIINNNRSIGIIKPQISTIEFSWNPYHNTYEVIFIFIDEHGDKYNFLCIDAAWQNYWIDFLRREPLNINSQLLKIKWMLNENNTYFVVGFTKKFNELPGPFNGSWPLILGVYSLKK